MLDCWYAEPAKRLTFEGIRKYFTECLNYMSMEYSYLRMDDSQSSLYEELRYIVSSVLLTCGICVKE